MWTAALLVLRTVIGNVSCLPGCVCSSYFAGETSTEISADEGAVKASPRTAIGPRTRTQRGRRITFLSSAVPFARFSPSSRQVALLRDDGERDDRGRGARGRRAVDVHLDVLADVLEGDAAQPGRAGVELVTARRVDGGGRIRRHVGRGPGRCAGGAEARARRRRAERAEQLSADRVDRRARR